MGDIVLDDANEYSKEIETLHEQITVHLEMIARLKAEQKEKYIPISVKRWLEESLAETEVEISKVTAKNDELITEKEALEAKLTELQSSTTSKEQEHKKIVGRLATLKKKIVQMQQNKRT
eukprot:Colp12_sorted_trinity150504_noHs@21934